MAQPDETTTRVSRAASTVSASAHRWAGIAKLVPLAGGGLTFAAALVNLAIGALPLGFLVGSSVVVQRVVAVAAEPSAGRQWAPALLALGLSVGALVLQNLVTPAQAALGELVTRRVDGRLTRRLMRSAMVDAPMQVLDSQDVLDKLSEARNSLQTSASTPGGAVAGLFALVARYTQLLGSVAIVGVVLGPGWGAVICGCALVARFGNRGSLTRWSLTWRQWAWASRRKIRYVYDSATSPALAKEMRLLAMLGWWRQRALDEASTFFTRLWRERRQIYFTPFLVFTAVVLAGTAATLLALEAAATGGHLDVLHFVLAAQAILVPLRFGVFFPEADVHIQYGMNAWEAMKELEQRFSQGASDLHTGTRPATGLPTCEIRFQAVHFAYPGSTRRVLDQLDLVIEAGRSTAIVGFNGAGKTTLVKLLAALYRPTSGTLTVDGTDLAELDTRSWQDRIAVIFQDFVRYELDAGTNIALGGSGAAGATGEAIAAAAALAGATDVLACLPDGLRSPLSSRYAGGADLSGGQWQRIALARAMYAVGAGASVLVLDEPTAQLDVRAEVAFFDNFLDLTRGLTTVVISHRFSTVRRAERIVVLDGGRVSEQGSHEELLSLGGRYAELFELQARRFSEAGTGGDQYLAEEQDHAASGASAEGVAGA